MKPRLYFDTSVFGGVFDEEFQSDTQKLFDMAFDGQIVCIYSDLTISELENAPQLIKDYFINLPKEVLEKVEVTEEGKNLAEKISC